MLACAFAGPGAAAQAVVTDVRVGGSAKATRIVFEFSRPLSFSIFSLTDPYRVVIDMPEVGWRLPPRPLPKRIGVFDKLRYGLHRPGNSRVVLDMTGPVAIRQAFVLAAEPSRGHRFVLDLVPTSHERFLGGVKGPPLTVAAQGPAPRTAATPALAPPQRRVQPAEPKKTVYRLQTPTTPGGQAEPAPQSGAATANASPAIAFNLAPRKPAIRPRREKRTIVIDPGHGGVDPGTIGISGVYEKHITLSMGRELKQHLEAGGRYRVILTRSRDLFIRLRDRVRLGREAGADLFISVHADTVKNRAISGPAVYTLSEKASDQEAQQLAEKENKADLIAGVDLTHENPDVANILIDLAQRESMNQSARFANLLIKRLKHRTKVLRNTHRFAGFAVLKAPDTPSVLLELGFLSNPRDERSLRRRAYRARIAAAVGEAIDEYFLRVEEANRQ